MTGSVTWFNLAKSYLRLHLASRGNRALTIAMTLLLGLAALRGGRETALARASYAAAVADERADWADTSAEQWVDAGVRKGRWLYLPPLPSQALADGVSRLQSTSCHTRVGIAPAHRLDLTDGALSWTPELRRLGSLDVGYVLLLLLPLWGLFVSYDSISGEKQRGTLKTALAGSASRAQILMAKLTGCVLAVLVPSAVALLGGLGASTLIARLPWIPATRLLAFLGVLTAYVTFYVCVGMVASSCTAFTRTSLAIVMMVWVFCSFLQPRVNMLIVGMLRPMRSTVAFEIDKRSALAEARRSYVEEHHSGTSQNWMLERLILAGEAIGREQKLRRAYDSERTQAQGLADTLMLFSPFGLAQTALLDLAGTSPSRYRGFRQACDEYRWQMTQHFVAALDTATEHEGNALPRELSATKGRAVLDHVPAFAPKDPSDWSVARSALLRALLLLGLALVLAVVSLYQFGRYDAR